MRCTPHEIHGILYGHARTKTSKVNACRPPWLARAFLSLEDGRAPEFFLQVLIHGRHEGHVLDLVADKLLLRHCAPAQLVVLTKLTLKVDVVVILILGLAQEHAISEDVLLTLPPMAGVVEGWILGHWALIPALAAISHGTLWQVAGIVEVRNQVVLPLVPALAIVSRGVLRLDARVVPVVLLGIYREVLAILAQVDLCLEADVVHVEFLGIHPQVEVLTILAQVILCLEVGVVGQKQRRPGQLLFKVQAVLDLDADIVEIDVCGRLVGALAEDGGVVLSRVLVWDLGLGLLARSLPWFPRLEGPDVQPPGFHIGLLLQSYFEDGRVISWPPPGAKTDTLPACASVPHDIVFAAMVMAAVVPWAMPPGPPSFALGYMPLVVGRVYGDRIAVCALIRLAAMYAFHMGVEGGPGPESLGALLASKASLVVVVADHVEGGRGFGKREVKVERVLFQLSLIRPLIWVSTRDLPLARVLLLSRSS